MSNRLVAVRGNTALVAGSKGIATYALPGLTKIGSADGSFIDVDFIEYGRPVAISLKQGNPATASLRIFESESLGARSYDRVSFNPPALGRIDGSDADKLVWAQGTKFRVDTATAPGRVIDTGYPITDIGMTLPNECAIASGSRVMSFDVNNGVIQWTAILPTTARFLVADEDYVVAWGAGVMSGGAITVPVTVLDADTGALVATINQTGTGLITCASIVSGLLYVGKPKYVTGQAPKGQIDIYDLTGTDVGVSESTVEIPRPPLAIAATSDGGCVWVNGDPGYLSPTEMGFQVIVLIDDAPMDPYEYFVASNTLTPKERAVMDMINAFAPQPTAMAYSAILAALRG